MSLRRFGPLMVLVIVGLAVLITRLYDVQVKEHELWAREAASLVRSATIEEHRRGHIEDRKGRLIVRDQEVYKVDFVWRDFRRGHPLGAVAQARSLLFGRPETLSEVWTELARYAEELVLLSPDEIAVFGRGGELLLGNVRIPDLGGKDRRQRKERARLARRGARANDLSFYVRSLLAIDVRELRDLRQILEDKRLRSQPFLELAARVRRGPEGESHEERVMRLRRELRDRADRSLLHLTELAQAIDWEQEDMEHEVPLHPTSRLVEILEESRRGVEDATADRLFRIAMGFGPGRLDEVNLARLDLTWLMRCLDWNGPRLEQWARSRGQYWESAVEDYLAGHVFARIQVPPEPDADADLTADEREMREDRIFERVLDALAHFFVSERHLPDPTEALMLPWREADQLVVLERLPELFVGADKIPAELLLAALPFQDPGLRTARGTAAGIMDAVLADMAGLPGFDGQEGLSGGVDEILELARSGRSEWQKGELLPIETVLLVWDARLQERIDAALRELSHPVRLRGARLDLALEDRNHVVKDLSSRPQRFLEQPDYDLVHLITRYPERYAGFHVRPTSQRVGVTQRPGTIPKGAKRTPAGHLIGRVRPPQLVSLLGRRDEEAELNRIERKLDLEESDRSRIEEIVSAGYHPEQQVGGNGIEAAFDAYLRGRNGYRVTLSLQERRQGGGALFVEPVDGANLALTLDLDLQETMQSILEAPTPPPPEELKPDLEWYDNPVGAMVLLTPQGDLLAAASTPSVGGVLDSFSTQDGEYMRVLDRTLRQPKFQPPGSIFKPLVAVWAMQYRGLNPDQPLVHCRLTLEKFAGYGEVHCHNEWGHSATDDPKNKDIDLERAVLHSCNAYFAYVGDALYDKASLQAMAASFGFGRPTGIGLFEDFRFDGALSRPGGTLEEDSRQRLGNGLSLITCTPMQVARAYAGLATGKLPAVRVVSHIGGELQPRSCEPLLIDSAYLELMRELLDGVVNQPGGSAHGKGLSEDELGFRFAAKTGSADYKKGLVPDYKGADYFPGSSDTVDGMRKHTWVAGWFPSDEPKAILVVYVHDTATTSSHGAVYVAGEFLSSPAVRAFLDEEQSAPEERDD